MDETPMRANPILTVTEVERLKARAAELELMVATAAEAWDEGWDANEDHRIGWEDDPVKPLTPNPYRTDGATGVAR